MAQKYVKEDSLPARKKERQNCFANFVAKIGSQVCSLKGRMPKQNNAVEDV